LQEVDRNKKRTGNVNSAKKIAEELRAYYCWAAPPPSSHAKEPQEEETGVSIISPFPLSEVDRLVLPNEGPGGRRRAAIGATVHIGDKLIRVYSVHAETRIEPKLKLEQYRFVLNDALKHRAVDATVILGDFNSWQGEVVDETEKAFTATGFATPFSKGEPTWHTFILKLKLDWMWLNGLRVQSSGIGRSIGLSDHWPLWVTASFEKPQAKKPEK